MIKEKVKRITLDAVGYTVSVAGLYLSAWAVSKSSHWWAWPTAFIGWMLFFAAIVVTITRLINELKKNKKENKV